MAELLGVVLAGGLSRRMEGPEKSLLELGGIKLITHVTNRLNKQVNSVVINANGDPKRFDFLKLPIVPDTVEGFAGPLAGVLAGMRWAADNTDASHVITAAADTPFFPHDYVSNMFSQARSTNSLIALAASNDRRHPVFGLWPVSLADALEAFLVEEKNRKVMLFVERYTNCLVEFPGDDPDPFFNINTPDDKQKAEQILSEQIAR
ncbi:MAG: molybdenum cofactor guanylyltransferase MobA [Pseudomonadota bacterium]